MIPKDELKEIRVKLFNAENNRDWKLYETFLSQDVKWISYGPPRRKTAVERAECVKTMVKAYQNLSAKFEVLDMVSDLEKDTIQMSLSDIEKELLKKQGERMSG